MSLILAGSISLDSTSNNHNQKTKFCGGVPTVPAGRPLAVTRPVYHMWNTCRYCIGHVTAGGLPVGTVGMPPQNSAFDYGC